MFKEAGRLLAINGCVSIRVIYLWAFQSCSEEMSNSKKDSSISRHVLRLVGVGLCPSAGADGSSSLWKCSNAANMLKSLITWLISCFCQTCWNHRSHDWSAVSVKHVEITDHMTDQLFLSNMLKSPITWLMSCFCLHRIITAVESDSQRLHELHTFILLKPTWKAPNVIIS